MDIPPERLYNVEEIKIAFLKYLRADIVFDSDPRFEAPFRSNPLQILFDEKWPHFLLELETTTIEQTETSRGTMVGSRDDTGVP